MQKAKGPCGKVGYVSRSRAEKIVVVARKRRGEELRAYHHDRCGQWHVTSKDRVDA